MAIGYESQRASQQRIATQAVIAFLLGQRQDDGMASTSQYPPVGECIYCGARSYKPSSSEPCHLEHAIPESLNGNIELPEASCHKCEGITSGFERVCARTIFGPARYRLNLFSKRPHDRPKELPITLRFSNPERERKIMVPIAEYPALILLPGMKPPRLLHPQSGEDKSDHILYAAHINSIEEVNDTLNSIARHHGANQAIAEGASDTEALKLLLAKIAHCLAVAHLGNHNFVPFLQDIIRRRDAENLNLYVGIDSTRQVIEKSNNLHDCSLEGNKRGKFDLIVARICLFSRFECPIYTVVVGRTYWP